MLSLGHVTFLGWFEDTSHIENIKIHLKTPVSEIELQFLSGFWSIVRM